MSAILGNKNKFYLKSSSTYTWLTGEQSNSVNRTQEAIEVSDKSTDWAQFIGGKKGATIEATVFADNSDSAQASILSSLASGDDVEVFIGQLSNNAPSSGDAGMCVITAISDTNDFGAVSTRTISLTVNGALTHTGA
jgi:predicted secreted protein